MKQQYNNYKYIVYMCVCKTCFLKIKSLLVSLHFNQHQVIFT